MLDSESRETERRSARPPSGYYVSRKAGGRLETAAESTPGVVGHAIHANDSSAVSAGSNCLCTYFRSHAECSRKGSVIIERLRVTYAAQEYIQGRITTFSTREV